MTTIALCFCCCKKCNYFGALF